MSDDLKKGLIKAQECPSIVEGDCVIMHGDEMIYAGPIGLSTNLTAENHVVLLSPKDYEGFIEFTRRRKN